MSDEESVFSRWSRRKRATPEVAPPEVAPEPAAIEVAEPETEDEEAALLETLGLPRPESLGEGDDFQPFMQAGVPEFLKKRALRVLWRSNPVLANLDGLNDYDDDFNSPELTQKVLATGYQVGRGFVKKVTEIIDGEDAPEDEPDPEVPVDNVVAESESSALDDPPNEVALADPDPDPAPRPRRMRFET